MYYTSPPNFPMLSGSLLQYIQLFALENLQKTLEGSWTVPAAAEGPRFCVDGSVGSMVGL